MALFELIPTKLEGCFEIQPRVFEDQRGRFVKVFHKNTFHELGLIEKFEEEYYSVSSKGTLRGLHFQTPPDEHVKIVTSLEGKILDIVVDLRKKSDTFGQYHVTELDAVKGNMMYVPSGFAHGFYVLSKHNTFLSMNSRKFSPECDAGIKWNSIGYNWPDKNPVVSEKDDNMPELKDFKSPF